MGDLNAYFPESISFTTQENCIVKNDFYFSFRKTVTEGEKCINTERTAGKYPRIYITGLEKLFRDDGHLGNTMDLFARSFHAVGTDDWSVSYGKNDKGVSCIVVTCNAFKLESEFTVDIVLSDKVEFTGEFKDGGSICADVEFVDFDTMCTDLSADIVKSGSPIRTESVAYIDDLVLMDANGRRVSAIHKGDVGQISWSLGNVDKVSASLCDENGYVVTNLAPYFCKIDKDRRFTLSVEKDGKVVSRSLPVYRTLWKKDDTEGEISLDPDENAYNKFFTYNSKYYYYKHPYLYESEDLIKWFKFTEYFDAPKDHLYYTCSFSESNSGLIICYTCEDHIIYREYQFCGDKWGDEKTIDNVRWSMTHAIKRYSDTIIAGVSGDMIQVYTITENSMSNPWTLLTPEHRNVISVDMIFDKDLLLAVLCDNGRVYLYDVDDEFKNNIFEFENADQKRVDLVKTNSVYIVLDDYVFEIDDKDKFLDMHFSLRENTAKSEGVTDNAFQIVGERDGLTFSAIICNGEDKELWNYKF
ncbi:hypothetical protein [Ruminococcus albus]|uniref:hypothetical protein n=1 Tax=Ruminococcus albus TaxID=1264 RepID=UPI00046775A7|nr:hypothetical protein [Ruminococcus albus]